MGLSKLKLQHLKEVCQEEDIDYSGLRRKKDLIESINEVCEARRPAVEDEDGEDEVEIDEDVASVASQPVSPNGSSNCSREESTDIFRLRLQLELARAEKEKVEAEKRRVQAEREMMREKSGTWISGRREMLVHLLQSICLNSKVKKMIEQTNDVLSFLMFLKKTSTLHGIQGPQMARIFPSLLNEKANKIYSRLDIDTCR